MYELEELRKKIAQQDYVGAMQIVDELEEMTKEDKLNKIYSYMVILLLHLIKQEAESRTTSSWERSIMNSVDNINRVNKRRNAVLEVSPQHALRASVARTNAKHSSLALQDDGALAPYFEPCSCSDCDKTRRKSGGYYASAEALQEIVDEAYPRALREASFEAFEGKFNSQELDNKVDAGSIKRKAMQP